MKDNTQEIGKSIIDLLPFRALAFLTNRPYAHICLAELHRIILNVLLKKRLFIFDFSISLSVFSISFSNLIPYLVF